MLRRLPLSLRIYVWFVITAGVLLLIAGLPQADFNEPWLFATLLALSSATAALKVTLPLTTSRSTLSVSYAVDFASLLMIGPHETMLVAATSAFTQCHVNKKANNPTYRTLFSMASLIVTVQGTGLVYHWLQSLPAEDAMTAFARPLVGAATVYFLLNTGLVAMAVGLSSREKVFSTWQTNFLWSAPSYFVGAATAAAATWLIQRFGYWIAPLTVAPMYLTYRTYKVYMGRIEDEQRHVIQTSELHLATIEALARAIDAKDQTTQTHVRRVQAYAAGLAKAAGLSKSEIQGVKTAALLHDIGKLAVPEHILSKPGPLTQEEFQKIRIHPQVGAEIIAAVPFPYPVAPLILSHHERWDGQGYPQGLAGEDIPIGARILSIVDYFDAITTDRPYHKPLGHQAAIGLLKHEGGRALDPKLVDRFIDVLPALMAEAAAAEPAPAAATEVAAGGGSTATGLIQPATNVFDNIALAHREIYALYEIAQTMGTSLGVADTMALVSAKLVNIIPWTGCTLFLQEPNSEILRCRFASGVDLPRLLDSTLRVGEGLAGWVARNRRTLVNGDPRTTFEAIGIAIKADLRSAIVCPLFFNDAFIGCLTLFHSEPNYYTEDHRRLIERVAEQAGAVLHNSIVFEQTQEDSLTDPLTSLPNRRSMFMYLSRELARSERRKTEMALIVLDLDEFKAINDNYGHHVGDAALREAANALQRGLRPYDLCVRYAGDEFIVVLPECSRALADTKRRELQEIVGRVQLEVRPGRRISLSASAGVAVFPHDGDSYETLLADADAHMYRDKTARRRSRVRADLGHIDPAEALLASKSDSPSESVLVAH
ncbi:MAG TPA: HD domain-containing phosphohydrolase [Vicinamibacterales bacterium]|nr:HD domain-containing phosphohydrolase [Vicinamibacterales bacterium]